MGLGSAAWLQEVIDKAEGTDVAEEKKEMEELIQLLPDIKEKIEDAQESQGSGGVASEGIHQTLVSQWCSVTPLYSSFMLPSASESHWKPNLIQAGASTSGISYSSGVSSLESQVVHLLFGIPFPASLAC